MSYRDQLEKAKRRYQALETERAALLQVIQGLEVLAREEANSGLDLEESPELNLEGVGFTDAIRSILEARGPLTAPEVKNALANYGYTYYADADPKNQLISVHTVLRRLIKAGEVEETKLASGEKGYKFISELERSGREAFLNVMGFGKNVPLRDLPPPDKGKPPFGTKKK